MKRREALWASAAVLSTPAMAGLKPVVKAPVAPVPADVINALNIQATLWTAGDLDGFCALYAEHALFLSPGGLTRGRAEVLARYRKKYVDGPDGKAGMGALTFAIEDARGSDTLAMVALRWTLTWPAPLQKPPATGLSLVTLENFGSGTGDASKWLILHDASM